MITKVIESIAIYNHESEHDLGFRTTFGFGIHSNEGIFEDVSVDVAEYINKQDNCLYFNDQNQMRKFAETLLAGAEMLDEIGKKQ